VEHSHLLGDATQDPSKYCEAIEMTRARRWRTFLIPIAGALLAIGLGSGIAAGTGVDGFWFFLGVVALSSTTLVVLVAVARRSRDALSPLGLAAIFYLLGYAVGGVYFWLDPQPSTPLLETLPYPPTHASLTSAIWIATLAWVTLVIGYWVNPLKRLVGAIPRLPSTRSVASLPLLLAPLFLAGWAARLSLVAGGRYFHRPFDEEVATGSSYVVYVIGSFPLVATAFVGAYYYFVARREPTAKRYRNAFLGLAAIELLWAIPTGSRGQMVGVLTMLVVVAYYGISRVPVTAVITVTLVVVFVIFPFVLYYRNDSTDYRVSPEHAFSSAAPKTFDRPPSDVAAEGLVATFSRFSDVASLAEIVSREPSYSSRKPGETLVWTVEGLLPRAILPSKGDPGLFGNEFGRTYGLNAPTNHITSIAVTQPGELYMNYAVLGVLIMLAVGAVYRSIGDYLGDRGDDPASLAIYAALSWPILSSHETILASGLAGVLKMLVAFALALALAIAITTPRLSGSPKRASSAHLT
jgi:hypothetical protein